MILEGSELSFPETIAGARVQLPDNLGDVTTIDTRAECDPQSADMTVRDVERIWKAVTRLYQTGLHPSITLVLRRHGRVVLKRAMGTMHGGQPDPRDALDL